MTPVVPVIEFASASLPAMGGGSHAHGSLPSQLSAQDRERYAHIFSAQEAGRFGDADAAMRKLDNKLLLGHVWAQRYLHADYRSDIPQLESWLKQYKDHPQAVRILRLLRKKQIESGVLPPDAEETDEELADDTPGTFTHDWRGRGEAKRLWSQLNAYLEKDQVTKAYQAVSTPDARQLLQAEERAMILAKVVMQYLTMGKGDLVLSVAKRYPDGKGSTMGRIYWAAGLVSWQRRHYADAVRYFARCSQQSDDHTHQQSAADFWAARSSEALGRTSDALRYLDQAKRHPRHFYGLLAQARLGKAITVNREVPRLSHSEADTLLRISAVKRAIALVEVGALPRAEEELELLASDLPPEMAIRLVTLTVGLNQPPVQIALTRTLQRRIDTPLDYAAYPLPDWQPQGGFQFDRALVLGFIRQESRFNPQAISSAGARGLMQLMPTTAEEVETRESLPNAPVSALFEPSYNMKLGQRYLARLMRSDGIGENLVWLAAAYNAGPGNLRRWKETLPDRRDPLFIIETLPARETRHYVKQVLANYWMYQAMLGDEPEGPRYLITGHFPPYQGER